jgi:cytochrome c
MRTDFYAYIAAAGICIAIAAPPSFAQRGPANPQRGHELAARLCTNCHVIDRQTSGPVRADIPGFPTIAAREGATAEYLAGRIIVPHPAMPNIALTADDIRDIVTYIITLKRND